MKIINKLIIINIFLSIVFIFTYVGIKSATVNAVAINDTTMTINVTFAENYTHPGSNKIANMSKSVYVGSNSSPFGTGSVIIPLTSNGTAIIDADSTDDVPGLHITRGNGYVRIAAYGHNNDKSKESVKATLSFSNASIDHIKNSSSDPYGNPRNGTCGVVEGKVEDSDSGDDEYTFGTNSGSICSTTDGGSDVIRIYYNITPTYITCSTNSQCGTNGYTGSPFCQSGNVYQNYITHTCNNPGTSSSFCSNSPTAQLKTTCSSGQTCQNGECICLPATVDLKANNSDGPITVAYQNRNSLNLFWTSQNATSCTSTSTDNVWSGSKSVSGSQTISLSQVKTYTLTLTCVNSAGGSPVSDSVQVTLQAPTAPTVVTKGVVVTY